MSSETIKDLMPQTPDLHAERLAKLKELFPDLFTGDGQLNDEELRKLVAPHSINETERYEFRWFGKSQSKRNAFMPSRATLVFDEARSVNPHSAENLIIEGENLEVLKLLLSAYREEIKCIYIDPPYNTGKDFVYSDNYTEERKPYWEQTGVTENGVRVDTNAETDGRFHSNWLNMIYSRLLVARQLLRLDGVIFISIDDNEVHNLRRLCDEIFGEENFINQISIKVKDNAGESGGGEDKRLKKNIEYILMYARSRETYNLPKIFDETTLTQILRESDNGRYVYSDVLVSFGKKRKLKTIEDGDGNPIEVYVYEDFEKKTVRQLADAEGIGIREVYNRYFDRIYTTYNARTSIRDRVVEAVGGFSGLVEISYKPKTGKYKGQQVSKYFSGNTMRLWAWLKEIAEVRDREIVIKSPLGTLWDDISFASLAGEGEVKFENGKKPVALISKILNFNNEENGIILDFFAGSGTVGQAVLEANKLEERYRFILVQLPEAIAEKSEAYKAGYKKISDMTIERNRRVVERITAEKRRAHPNLFEDAGDADALKGLGFKVFRLEKSYFPRTEWSPAAHLSDEENVRALKQYIAERESQFGLSFDRDKLLTEILLKEGFKLNYTVAAYPAVTSNQILHVSDGNREALVCLDPTLEPETVEHFKTHAGLKLICLERALDTTKKWNLHHFLGEKFKPF